jgi:CDP-diacylglycerol--glycerol-3-phosphate 3-phosphatidyltransferase
MNIATTKGQTKSLSLPNILTYARIAAIPVVVGCVFAQSILDGPLWLRWVALAVFIAAGVTDYLDGYYARIWDQQSAFGRMLDPIADKLLVASCLLMLAADETIKGWSLWAAIVILCREILVSGLREYLAELRVSVPVSRLAKLAPPQKDLPSAQSTTARHAGVSSRASSASARLRMSGTSRKLCGGRWISTSATFPLSATLTSPYRSSAMGPPPFAEPPVQRRKPSRFLATTQRCTSDGPS